jgi:hypothetical protein
MPRIGEPIDTKLIQKVCCLQDDVYRNQWITYVYDHLSREMNKVTGGGANWFTYARWSSFTVGENLRLDKPSQAFDELLEAHWLLNLARGRLRQMQRDLRMRNDRSMPLTLALGNKLVFDEIAFRTAEFLDWYAGQTPPLLDAWTDYRLSIDPSESSDLFPSCDVEWMRDGLESYLRAAITDDPAEKMRWVLRGNVLLAAYEQWRLQPIVDIALDPAAGHLVSFEGTDLHSRDGHPPRAVLRRRGTAWALRHRSPLVEWLTELYAAQLTTRVMAWQGKLSSDEGSVFLGRGLADVPPGEERFPAALRNLNRPELLVVQTFDRSDGSRPSRAARNWARYSDRMNFIVNLFRATQHDRALFQDLDDEDCRLVALDLSEANLGALRLVGDPPIDAQLTQLVQGSNREPRQILLGLMRDRHLRGIDDGGGELPTWIDLDLLRTGQAFLCRHGLEIATALFFASLPYSYTAGKGSAVLMRTAELTTGRTNRRIAETGQMLLDLMTVDPEKDPLAPGTVASDAARGVRLFHAVVRGTIRADREDRWPEEELGAPVNQEDLLGTLIVFTIVVLDALETLGISFADATGQKEREAYVHFWLVVGHLLGIDYSRLRSEELPADVVPLTIEELRLLQTAIFRRHSAPSLDGQTLTAALLEATSAKMPWPLKGYPAAAMRALLGRDVADALGVPPAGAAGVAFDAVQLATNVLSRRSTKRRIGSRLLTIPGPGDALALVARRATKTLYRRWIEENDGYFPEWRLAAACNWRLGCAPSPERSELLFDLTELEAEEPGTVPVDD